MPIARLAAVNHHENAAGQYQNFDAAVYIPVGVVRRLADPASGSANGRRSTGR
jgi:hypothetical protein